jgi:hypothetical protein
MRGRGKNLSVATKGCELLKNNVPTNAAKKALREQLRGREYFECIKLYNMYNLVVVCTSTQKDQHGA